MPIEMDRLVDRIRPENTVLLFGAGSSLPSGVPSAKELANSMATTFAMDAEGYTLTEITSLIEQRRSRREMIADLRKKIRGNRPTGGLLNLPLYNWRSIYTTNYDDLIEQCYSRKERDLLVYSSDFDFTVHDVSDATKLFKLHGTIDKDISDGNSSRIIITESDYDNTANFRDGIYDRLRGDLAGGHLIIVGYSLQDPDIKEIVNRSAQLGAKAPGAYSITLLLYVHDEDRALLYEKRGFSVCFGGIDDLFAGLASKLPSTGVKVDSENPLDFAPSLHPTTISVAHSLKVSSNLSAMFNGWPATYADINEGLTFERTLSTDIRDELKKESNICCVLLGASGVGKTTSARQALLKIFNDGHFCWEHQVDHTINVKCWVTVAQNLEVKNKFGVLLIDEAHIHLQQINDLVDKLVSENIFRLKLICVSTRNHWNPRIKTPHLFKHGNQFKLERLLPQEISGLLSLIETNADIRSLVEKTFSGFSPYERRRRLVDRCESEMFVCLKNIFASEKFDDIILREYAGLNEHYQEIYKHVAAMESAGIRVHRQLLIRLLGIPADEVMAALVHLTDIVNEYTISEREGLYGWKSRHHVIASIISKYKFPDIAKLIDLFGRVIDNISPTYDIEVLSLKELCNIDSGILMIPDKQEQNTLFRKMMSVAPGERVPRHRLIRNMINMGEFEKAETEIRIFEKDFGRDGPVERYKIMLLIARANTTVGILEEDRSAILEQARVIALNSIRRFPYNKSILVAYCELGFEIYLRTGGYQVFDDAMAQLKAGEDRIGDPDIPRIWARFNSRIRGDGSEFSPADEGVDEEEVEAD